MAFKLEKLLEWIDSDNIAEGMEDERLGEIGRRVVRDFEIDWDSCDEWRKSNEDGMRLAKQVREEKNFPWPKAANVKYPLITTACMNFAARAYPELLQGKDFVKCRVIGEDPDGRKQLRADRISSHMSWQLTQEMQEWEEVEDRLFHVLPVVGCLFKKTYFDQQRKRNCSEMVLPDECAINYASESLETARRFTHILKRYKNDLYENVARGVWLDRELGDAESSTGDEDEPHEFLEQHRFLDLDDDGYAEPYVVTVHRQTRQVVRITARFERKGVKVKDGKLIRIEPDCYFVKYGFIPNPDGGFLDIGFGTLLYPINEAVNATLNEMLDAGSMHNAGGGFIATGIRIKGGTLKFQLGEWKTVPTPGMDLRSGIVPLPTRDPSQVLFLLLGFLVEAGKDISSVKDFLLGEKPGENVAAETVLALIEQGMKVFSRVYKRIYLSLTQEFQKLFWLNGKYVDPAAYRRVLDIKDRNYDAFEDYNGEDLDVSPVADPNMTLDIERLTKARALLQIRGTNPMLNDVEILRRYFLALKIPDIEALFVQQQQPDPNIEKLYFEMDLMRGKFEFERQEIFSKVLINLAKIREIHASAIQKIADAEAKEPGMQLEQYRAFTDRLGTVAQGMQQMLIGQGGQLEGQNA